MLLGVRSLLVPARGGKGGCLAWNRTRTSGVRDRHAADYATRQVVAREGSAPPISGCRPDVILFHHRAEKIGNNIGNLLASIDVGINNMLVNGRCICSIRSAIISA